MRSVLILFVLMAMLSAGCLDQKTSEETSAGEHAAAALQPVTADWVADGVISEGEYTQDLVLSGGKFEVHWKNDADDLYMGMKGKTEGWLAVGFEPTVWMKDADMILGRVMNGQTTVLDLYSTGNYGPHPQDVELGGTDDILESGGREGDGYTVIEFRRKMDTGDRWDKAFVPGQTVEMIWSTSDSDSDDVRHDLDGENGLTFEG
ncbi:MAG: DOMON domain-containing protein [Methanotrichaceae archaeon]